jgi:adenylosuccinate lyase
MIHPIEYRYGTPEMKAVWTEENKLMKFLEVETALARAEAEAGIVPKKAAEVIARNVGRVKLERVKEIEKKTQHDVMAVVLALSENCGEHGEWVHFGATSYDIVDTALALQIKDAINILEGKLKNLRKALVSQAERHKKTVCIARTHGQIAIPTTYGMRFALWAEEIDRHIDRLNEIKPRILAGKMSGAVGTQASFGKKGLEIEKKVMKNLGLDVARITNQVVQRDRHAEFIFSLANLATTLDKICIEIRILQRSEIGELEESFAKGQVGSSTMPHKRNPVKSEQVCGLARSIRALVEPALMNNTLWDERDLTNSSCERIIFPEATVLTDHILSLTTNIIENLRFYPKNIQRNLDLLKGLNMSEAVMIKLAARIGRQTAHELMRKASMEAFERDIHLRDVLMEKKEVAEHFTEKELNALINPENYTGTAVEKVEMVIDRLKNKR